MKTLTKAALFGGAVLLGNYITGVPLWKALFKKIGK